MVDRGTEKRRTEEERERKKEMERGQLCNVTCRQPVVVGIRQGGTSAKWRFWRG